MNNVESTDLSYKKKVSNVPIKVSYVLTRFVNFTTHLGAESRIKGPMTLQNVFVRGLFITAIKIRVKILRDKKVTAHRVDQTRRRSGGR